MTYNDIWFVLMGVLLTAYGVLDGFDFGVGILHLRAKTDEERRLIMNSIGPLWDGNEVWLVVFGGALFAAFPNAYATALSGYYVLIMLMLCALIFRAVSIEFRSKKNHPMWRQTWDIAFCVSSTLAAFIFGVSWAFVHRTTNRSRYGIQRSHPRSLQTVHTFSWMFRCCSVCDAWLHLFVSKNRRRASKAGFTVGCGRRSEYSFSSTFSPQSTR